MRSAAVIGAGLAGLTAARALADAGLAVTVFEKSRGLGGRLATRRTRDGLAYDHGAPVAHGLAQGFPADAAAPFRDGLTGRPGISDLVAPLAAGLTVRLQTEIAAVAPAGAGWAVDGAPFDVVICAAPAPQTARLCAASAVIATAAAQAEMTPCWTLMAAFDAPCAAPAAAPPPFAALERMADRPDRAAAPDRWVAHASLAWTVAHLERDKPAVEAALLSALAPALGRAPAEAVHAVAHRWRYARVARPAPTDGALVLRDGALAACGDWTAGPEAGDAARAGAAAAAALLA